MTDPKLYFPQVWQTNEGWKANCPKCDDSKRLFHWNDEKQVGCCFHSSCNWFYQKGGVSLKRLLAHFSADGLIPNIPEVIRNDKEAEVKLPDAFIQIKNLPTNLRDTLYAYLKSRDLPKRVVDGANVGYCLKGRWWGYIIFPVLNDDGHVVYWQARRFKDREPKFYNPKASYKSELVYRVNPSVRPRRIVLVESIINALTLENLEKSSTVVMAILGKSLSDVQLQYVLSFEKNLREVIIALDGDARRDAVAMAEKFWSLNLGILTKVAPIPDGEDINSLGRIDAFERIDEAELFQYTKRMEMITRRVA